MTLGETQIIAWLAEDKLRTKALETAAELGLADWCIAAGFVRNLVWDKLHGYHDPTPLNDLDLVYFDPANTDKSLDQNYERVLKKRCDLPWSVKNQARMHLRNGDSPYLDCAHAISHWVEIETVIGAFKNTDGEVKLVAPLGLESLFSSTITYNQRRANLPLFFKRVSNKQWLSRWPKLSTLVS